MELILFFGEVSGFQVVRITRSALSGQKGLGMKGDVGRWGKGI